MHDDQPPRLAALFSCKGSNHVPDEPEYSSIKKQPSPRAAHPISVRRIEAASKATDAVSIPKSKEGIAAVICMGLQGSWKRSLMGQKGWESG